MAALNCHEEEVKRAGEEWRLYHCSLSTYYGLIFGSRIAEGFITHKSIYG